VKSAIAIDPASILCARRTPKGSPIRQRLQLFFGAVPHYGTQAGGLAFGFDMQRQLLFRKLDAQPIVAVYPLCLPIRDIRRAKN
jgi:hypothetical protein